MGFAGYQEARNPSKSQASRASRGAEAGDEEDNDDIRIISQQIMDKKAFIWAFGKNKDGEIGIGS